MDSHENRTLEQIFQFIVAPIAVTLISMLLSFISSNQDNSRVLVCTSISKNDIFYTAIGIKNYKDRAMENFNVSIANHIDLREVVVDTQYSINGNTIKLDYIQPKESITLIAQTSQAILKNDISVDAGHKSILAYVSDFSSFSDGYWRFSIMSGVYYFIMALVLEGRSRHRNKIRQLAIVKKEEEMDSKIAEIQKISEDVHRKYEKSQIKLDGIQRAERKMQIFYGLRISHLNKELTFWKDTIRKMLYDNRIQKNSPDDVFDIVTKTLKTYTVKEKTHEEIDELLILAHMVNDEKIDH